jgi:hypothetical protein
MKSIKELRNKWLAAKSPSELITSIYWGGYYSSEEDGKLGVFRLLDFNKDAYHVQLFKEKFEDIPSDKELKKLSPAVLHAPFGVGGLLHRKSLRLIAHSTLDKHTLRGYAEFLKQQGHDEVYVKEMIDRLITFSKEGPTKVRLVVKNKQTIVSLVT